MRISWNWLRELVDINLTPEELAETLTFAGFEVEDIEDRRTWAAGVVVGKVITIEPHPNADKLRVCQVDVGSGSILNIVCGAANVRAEALVPVAVSGTYLPKIDLKIRPSKLRGVRSEGMICSLSELGLEKTSEGIHIFAEETLAVGTDVRPLLDLDDVILDLTATANRADALSMVGVAREVAALTGGQLHLPAVAEISLPVGEVSLQVRETTACPAYLGTGIQGVKIAPAPNWLQQRLAAAGVRSINNVVDITNYVMLQWGQPLHAFDGDRLRCVGRNRLAKMGSSSQEASKQPTIGVRFAREEETLKTLDGQTRNLQAPNLVITGNDQPIALAGVMGGEETEVHEGTTNIVLEAALFEPITVRRSARAQGLRTESSARYERSVNHAELEIACNYAVALIIEIAGGTAVSRVVSDDRPDYSDRTIDLRLARIHHVLGAVNLADEEVGEITAADVDRILTALGCQLEIIESGDLPVWQVRVPAYRYRDLEREIDLIEEVARLYGYDNFCDQLPEQAEIGYLSTDEFLKRQIRASFRAAGLTELVHYTYAVNKSSESGGMVAIANPLFTEYSVLRRDLIPGLIEAFSYNQDQGNGVLSGFEIGKVFWREEEGLREADAIAGIFGGSYYQGSWGEYNQSPGINWYVAKGLLEGVFQNLGLQVEYQPDQQSQILHPGRTASLWISGQRLGHFGEIHPEIRAQKGMIGSVYAFELDLDTLLIALDREDILIPKFQVYGSYPQSDRDIAFFAPIKVTAAEITKVIHQAGGSLLASITLFDEYRGQNVPEGQRSLAFRLVYRSSDRTLTETEIEPIHQQVREALVEKFGVNLRS